MPRKRNPNQFTPDEYMTAVLIMTEGNLCCARKTTRRDKVYRYRYPAVVVGMCDRPALEPATRVFRTSIIADRAKKQHCRPEDFPPDGRGFWRIEAVGSTASKVMQRLDPLLTPSQRQRWRHIQETCR